MKCQPRVRALPIVVPAEEGLAVRACCLVESNRWGTSGRYFSILNWDSLNGLSSEMCGRLCDWVTPRSASRNATGLEVIVSLSAWIVVFGTALPNPHVDAQSVDMIPQHVQSGDECVDGVVVPDPTLGDQTQNPRDPIVRGYVSL
jgi:hypothetical protein